MSQVYRPDGTLSIETSTTRRDERRFRQPIHAILTDAIWEFAFRDQYC